MHLQPQWSVNPSQSAYVPGLSACVPGHSAYVQIYLAAETPFQADECIYRWLCILKEAGVDIEQYIKLENCNVAESRKFWPTSLEGTRQIETIVFEGVLVYSWSWYYNPDSRAFDVLDEFKNFGPEDL